MKADENNLVAICVLQNNNGEFLLVSRKNNLAHFGFPGGKVEPEEDLATAAVRELFEETGISILPSEIEHVYGSEYRGFSVQSFLCSKVVYLSGIAVGPEGTMMKWTKDEEELTSGPFSDYNRELLSAIKEKKC